MTSSTNQLRVLPSFDAPRERVLPSFDAPTARLQNTRDMLTTAYVLSRTVGSHAVADASIEILNLGLKVKPRARVIAYVTLLLASSDPDLVTYARCILFGWSLFDDDDMTFPESA
jgi:hypothetical protein